MLRSNDGINLACDAPIAAIKLGARSLNLVLKPPQEQAIGTLSLIRIPVVDDFADWRGFVLAKLRENCSLQVIGVVSDGFKAVLKAKELQPDLVLLDIGLPMLDGIGAARQIHKIAPKSKILFLSREIDPDVARAALNAGGHGYVVKLDADRELLPALEAVMLGKKFVSPRVADHPA